MSCPEHYKPSLALLKSSLRSRGKEYPRVAALHGIAYVADPTRPKFERIGWFLCILISAAATAGIIFTLMRRFQTDPMMNSLEIRLSDAPLDLPRFYLCPSWKSFNNYPPRKENEDNLYKQLYEWDFVEALFNKNRTYPDGLINTGSLRKFFIQNAPDCENIFRNPTLTVGGTRQNSSSFEMVFTTAGICCTLQLSGQFSNDLISVFSFNSSTFPFRIYATLENDDGLLRHLRLHEFLFSTYIMVELQETSTSPDAKVLARSQRKCFFPGEQLPYVDCVLNCKAKISLKLCGCVPWFLGKDNTKECPINKYQCLDSNCNEIMDVSKCNCRQSCDNIVLKNTEIVIRSPDKPCVVHMKDRSLLKYKRTVRFGWADLFISFGGIAGLFLGCSLLTIIEFGYYFSLRTYCGAVITAPKIQHNIVKINVRDARYTTDLTNEEKRRDLHKQRVNYYDYFN